MVFRSPDLDKKKINLAMAKCLRQINFNKLTDTPDKLRVKSHGSINGF